MKKNYLQRPVLRWPGSKFKKLQIIFEIMNLKNGEKFLDAFAGSGIVGVNAKKLFNVNLTINDYDNIFPLTKEFVRKNMESFGGFGRNPTKSAKEYFKRRIANGYWEKFKDYNELLRKSKIIHSDFRKINFNKYDKIFIDPPYHEIKNLYKNHFKTHDHIELRNKIVESAAMVLITYNDTPFIRELYKNNVLFKIVEVPFVYSPGAGKTKKRTNEIFIIKNANRNLPKSFNHRSFSNPIFKWCPKCADFVPFREIANGSICRNCQKRGVDE